MLDLDAIHAGRSGSHSIDHVIPRANFSRRGHNYRVLVENIVERLVISISERLHKTKVGFADLLNRLPRTLACTYAGQADNERRDKCGFHIVPDIALLSVGRALGPACRRFLEVLLSAVWGQVEEIVRIGYWLQTSRI